MPYKNKEALYAAQSAYRKRNFDQYWKLLTESTCIDCGESDPVVLEFDHLPGVEKKFEISNAISGSTRSWKLILTEIEKCEIVCANCHRRRTARRGNFSRHLASVG